MKQCIPLNYIMHKSVPVLTLLFLLAFDARGQSVEWMENFQLYTGCKDVSLLVERIDPNDARLTETRVQTTVRSRLRGARIYTAEMVMNLYYLYVSVGVFRNAYSISVEFNKWLMDREFPELRGIAPTWSSSSIGTHSNDSGYILQNLGELVDTFIDQYLEINEDACK